ncbi:hypothetical protein [Bacillus cihuensis]|uniref:hypothetical protein n=1 Tax=Bacillus cihuensis TaxID=1208599 RepID=UPI0003FD059E|nr:hypothetical protein [Bacillus cihuensis]
MFRVTCFVKEKPATLLPLFLPLRFVWTKKNGVVWKNENVEFRIQPFTSEGRESHGYRIFFCGNPEAFQYLFDLSIGQFSPTITGVEYTGESEESQNSLVRLAEKNGFSRGSLYGIYEHKGIGVVLLPSGEFNLQIRNRKLTCSSIKNVMNNIEEVAEVFRPDHYDLFSFLEETAVTA